MKRFSFRFESVLKARKSREEECLRALGVAQQAYQRELNAKAALLSELESALRRRESLAVEPIGPVAFELEEKFIIGTKQRITRADQAILRASRGVEKALRAYLAARKQTRMMEVLREKDYAEYRKALAKHEQKRMDDISLMRARLKQEEIAS